MSNCCSVACGDDDRRRARAQNRIHLVTLRQRLPCCSHEPDERIRRAAMARRTIHFSDLTSQPILDDADVVRVVVIDHPVLDGGAVEFEAAAGELTGIDNVALDVAVIELHTAAEQPPRRVVLDAATFDKLAVDKPMDELLNSATPIRPNGRAERAPASRPADRVNYATLEHAGAPH